MPAIRCDRMANEERQVQEADEQQVGDPGDDQPGFEDGEPGGRDQRGGYLFEPRVVRADRQSVVDCSNSFPVWSMFVVPRQCRNSSLKAKPSGL